MYLGMTALEGTVTFLHQQADADGSPADAASLPVGRVYGPNGYLPDAAVAVALADSKAVTGAALNTGVVRLTVVGHGLVTGQRVVVASVGGITGANGTFLVSVVDADHFDLTGSSATGAYTSGGTVHSAGFYSVSVAAAATAGFDAGENYDIRLLASVSGDPLPAAYRFGVV